MSVISLDYNSHILEKNVNIQAIIPQGRPCFRTLYLLHGAGGDSKSWIYRSRIEEYVNLTNIAVIMPSGDNRFYIKNENGMDYYKFITEELVDNCEKWFNLSNEKKDRFIAGMSMGGYGAANIILNKTDMFSKVFLYSALVDIKERIENPQGIDINHVFGNVDKSDMKNYDLFNKSTNLQENVQNFVDNSAKIHIFCGLQDKLLDMNRRFYEHLKSNGFDVYYEESDGNHDFEYWDKCIKKTINIINED